MKISEDQHYDAGVDDVAAMLCDRDFLLGKFTSAGHSDIEILESGPNGDGFRCQSERTVPADVPGFAKRFAPDTNRVVQTEEWGPLQDGVRHGTWKIEIKGSPANIKGEAELRPDGDGCVNEIRGDLKVKVPLVGGKIEGFLGRTMHEEMTKEHAFGQKWIAEH